MSRCEWPIGQTNNPDWIRSGGPELLLRTTQLRGQRLPRGRVGLAVPMEGTRRRRTRKAVWDPTEDTRPQWREALTTRVLYREVCGLAARENGLAHLSLEDVVGKIAVHMRRDVSELEARDEAIAALVERYVQPSDSDSASDDEVCLVQLRRNIYVRTVRQ